MEFEKVIQEFLDFSLATYKNATASTALIKLSEEIKEVQLELAFPTAPPFLAEEYADCIMCLFDSAARADIQPAQLIQAFQNKLLKNKKRTWKDNGNGTYSHIKEQY